MNEIPIVAAVSNAIADEIIRRLKKHNVKDPEKYVGTLSREFWAPLGPDCAFDKINDIVERLLTLEQ